MLSGEDLPIKERRVHLQIPAGTLRVIDIEHRCSAEVGWLSEPSDGSVSIREATTSVPFHVAISHVAVIGPRRPRPPIVVGSLVIDASRVSTIHADTGGHNANS
jgi:hypothetical protein